MKLRQAVPRDASEIASIQGDAWRQGYAPHVPQDLVSAWTGYLTTASLNALGRGRTTGIVTVATHNRRVIGFCSTDKARLWSLFVRPDMWGKGAGKSLFTVAEGRCGAGIYLHTLRDNTRARGFFESQGLRVIAEINDLYFDFEVPSVVYAR
jgi:ribosomal protein S18 acetylase RimI-like enzyme